MSKYLRARGKPRIKRVLTPSLSIIYPLIRKSQKRSFSVKEKSVATLAYHTFVNTKMQASIIVGSATVSHNWRLS